MGSVNNPSVHSPRLAAYQAGGRMIRAVLAVARATEGDILHGVIYAAIQQVSLEPLETNPDLAERHGGPENGLPDSLRKAISVHALAGSLGMPYETTRRAVERLMARGLVRRVSRNGVIATAAGEAGPRTREAMDQLSHA
jgi:hypothetical protein